jgi:hypothetical protein
MPIALSDEVVTIDQVNCDHPSDVATHDDLRSDQNAIDVAVLG